MVWQKKTLLEQHSSYGLWEECQIDIKKTDRQECPQTKQPLLLQCEDACMCLPAGVYFPWLQVHTKEALRAERERALLCVPRRWAGLVLLYASESCYRVEKRDRQRWGDKLKQTERQTGWWRLRGRDGQVGWLCGIEGEVGRERQTEAKRMRLTSRNR